MFKPRDYQLEAEQAVEAAAQQGILRQLVVMATGLGKTELATMIARRRAGKTLFLVHRDELAQQALRKFRDRWPNASRGLVKADDNELGRRVTVASIQTVARPARLAELITAGPYDLVIPDEAHHAAAPSWRAVLDGTVSPKTLLVGLTATPGRADGRRLDDVFQKITFRMGIIEGIARGYLTDIEGRRVDLGINLDAVEVGADGDFRERPLAQLMSTPEVLRRTVRAWQELAPERRTVAFCVDVNHATELARAFATAGVRASVVTGETAVEDRALLYKGLREGRLSVLCSCMVLTEGWDEPAVDCILLARPTTDAGQGLYIQMVGRGVRLYPGKERCLLLDLVGSSERHSLAQLALLVGYGPEEDELRADAARKNDADRELQAPAHVPSLIEYATQVRRVDLLHAAWSKRRYEWVQTRFGHALDLGDAQLGFLLLRPDKETGGQLFRVIHVRFEMGWRAVWEKLTEPITVDHAMGMAEAEATRFLGGATKARWQKHDATWRNRPPTPQQLAQLERAGLPPADSRGAAAQALNREAVERAALTFSRSARRTAAGDRTRGHLKAMYRQGPEPFRDISLDSEALIDNLPDEDARRARALLFRRQKAAEEQAQQEEARA